MRRRGKGNIMLFAELCCITAALLWSSGGQRPAFGQESTGSEVIVRYSESYNTPEEIPDPPQEYEEEDGTIYRLVSERVEEAPVRGRRKTLTGQVLYSGVGQEEKAPEEAEMEVEDGESGCSFKVMLPFKKAEYTDERWQEDALFTVTFHSYGADVYRLGEICVPHNAKQPPFDDCRRELLEAAGLYSENFQIEDCRWQGEAYRDGNGVLCRDAAVSGLRRIWDCRAVYEGEVKLPDYNRYCLVTEYEAVSEEAALKEIVPEEAGEFSAAVNTGTEQAEDGKEGYPQWVRRLLWGTTVSVSILLLLAAVWGFSRLRKAASRMDEKL